MEKKLVRPLKGRMIAGVCLGVAEYFKIDVTVVRVIWALAIIPGGIPGILPYIVCWIIIPEGSVATDKSIDQND